MSDSLQPHGSKVAHQAPLSVGLSRQEYWKGLAIPFSRGSFPTQRWNLGLLHCEQILYHLSHQESIYFQVPMCTLT